MDTPLISAGAAGAIVVPGVTNTFFSGGGAATRGESGGVATGSESGEAARDTFYASLSVVRINGARL